MKRTFISLALIALFMLLITGCNHPAITSAKIYITQDKNPDKAIEQCKIAINDVPNNPEPYYLLGKAYAMKKMYVEMNEAFNQSLEKGPNFAKDIKQIRGRHWGTELNSGVALYQEDKPAEAAEKFATATVIDPTNPTAYKYLGSSLAQCGEDEKAIEALKNAVRLDEADIESQYQLGNLYYNSKKYEEAIEAYNKVLEKADASNKFYADALGRIGLSYDISGQPEKAEETYNKALSENPDNMDMRYNMARIYLNQEKWGMALKMMQPVYEANSEDFGNCMSMGWAICGMADQKDEEGNKTSKYEYKDAIPYFKKATELDPENHQAWFWLGTAYVRSGDSDNGKIAFDKSEELKSK